jgi:hypothetical protein
MQLASFRHAGAGDWSHDLRRPRDHRVSFVIAAGTPDGAGPAAPPPVMKGGDRVEVEISAIGNFDVNVVDE